MSARWQPSRNVILTELGDGTGVLLHLGTKFYYTLNATGVCVWKTLSDATSAVDDAALAETITRKFRVDADTAARDLQPLLAELLAEGLVERAQ